jgi:acetophenone carboxylase
VLDQDSFEIDLDASEQRRAAIRREPLEKGKPFHDFIQGWLEHRPPDDIMKHYGAWPDPRVEGYDKPFWGLYGDG